MKKLGAVLAILAAGSTATGARAESDFGTVVSGVEHRYAVHAQRVPMMGLVSFCAHLGSGGAVKGLKIAEFEHLDLAPGDDRLAELLRGELGTEWQPFVISRERGGQQQTAIFVRTTEHGLRMLIADYENSDLNIVRVELNGDQIAKWIENPRREAHHAAGRDAVSGDEEARNDGARTK